MARLAVKTHSFRYVRSTHGRSTYTQRAPKKHREYKLLNVIITSARFSAKSTNRYKYTFGHSEEESPRNTVIVDKTHLPNDFALKQSKDTPPPGTPDKPARLKRAHPRSPHPSAHLCRAATPHTPGTHPLPRPSRTRRTSPSRQFAVGAPPAWFKGGDLTRPVPGSAREGQEAVGGTQRTACLEPRSVA